MKKSARDPYFGASGTRWVIYPEINEQSYWKEKKKKIKKQNEKNHQDLSVLITWFNVFSIKSSINLE